MNNEQIQHNNTSQQQMAPMAPTTEQMGKQM